MPFGGLAIAGLVGSIGTGIYQGVSSDRERAKQQRNLDRLAATPKPKFGVAPQIGNIYTQASNEAANPQGYSGAETLGFQELMGRNYNTQYNNAVNRTGGQTGRFANAVLSANNLGAMNDFAARDAQIARANRQSALGRQGMAANVYQRAADNNTQADWNYRLMTEQALGGAIAQQKQNMNNTWNSVGNAFGTIGGYGASKYTGKPKTGIDPKFNSPDYSYQYGEDPNGINYVDPALYS
jgi:hypothetical protein